MLMASLMAEDTEKLPKSPIYRGAGNLKMKGRKTMRMRCGCCSAYDFRDDELKKEHKKEMDHWVSGLNQRFAKPSNP